MFVLSMKNLVIASLSLSVLAAAAPVHATSRPDASMVTSRNQTATGRHDVVSLRVLRGNSLSRSQAVLHALEAEIPGARHRGSDSLFTTPTALGAIRSGLKVGTTSAAVLQPLASKMEVRPFKPGERKVLTPRVAASIAKRLGNQASALDAEAGRLHAQSAITDDERQSAVNLAGRWHAVAKQFEVTAATLGKHGMAVEIDE